MDSIDYKSFEPFFASLDREKRYLLGFSGGSDSMFLFLLLKHFNINFIAAHVDYGWRKTSYEEALVLKDFSEANNVIFKLYQANKAPVMSKNAENNARKIRLQFFQKLCDIEGLAGVFLAHHCDDQIETVVKRFLEGSSLWNLRGLVPCKRMGDLLIFRPLLSLHKQEIINFLKRQDIDYITDETNFDLHYLRARLRYKILPVINEFFGKSFSSSLVRLSKSSQELLDFLNDEAAEFFSTVEDSSEVVSIDFSQNQPRSAFLWKFVIRKFFDLQCIQISQNVVDVIVYHCYKKSKKCSVFVSKFLIVLNDGKLTFYKKPRNKN